MEYRVCLIIVCVIDPFGKGYCVGHMLTTSDESIKSCYVFYHCLNENSFSELDRWEPKWIMSDDSGVFATAFEAVCHCSPQRLVCTWHLKKTWKRR